MNSILKAMSDYVFTSRYARYSKELKRRLTWKEVSKIVRDMHLEKYPQIEEDINWAFDLVDDKVVLGSQRALQFGGIPIKRHNARLYNCFSKNTPFITINGVKSFNDFKDGDLTIALTHKGNWKKSIIKKYGKQKLNRVTIKRGKETEYNIEVTPNHRWLLKNGKETTNLKIGDTLLWGPEISNFDYDLASPFEKLYWAYGYVYGDGTKVKDNNIYKYSMVRLCGEEIKYEYRFKELGFKTSSSLSLNGDIMVYTGKYLKESPNPDIDSPELIKAFVMGYLDADGKKNRNYKYSSNRKYLSIQSSEKDHIDFIRKCFPIAGMYIVSEKDLTGQITNFGVRDYTISFTIIDSFHKKGHLFKVENIEKLKEDDVWCLEVEDDHSFVLPFGLSTGNCSSSYCDRPRFFQEAMYLLLCGCGVGFSVQKHHIAKLPKIQKRNGKEEIFVIPDNIEGWSDAIGVLLSSYFIERQEFPEFFGKKVIFDYSQIRPEGSPLSSGVGKAPGPNGLKASLERIERLLDSLVSENNIITLRPINTYDIVCHSSDAVLSGGVRRSSCITLFSSDDEEMMSSKTGDWRITNPQRGRSNNSVLLVRNKVNKKYFKDIIEKVKQFGEPGFIFADDTESLVNPCGEVSMFAYETFDNKEGGILRNENGYPITGRSGWGFCNLTEINGKRIKTEEDFEKAVIASAIIGTCQAGYTKFPYLGEVTEGIVKREALLGCSITGIMDNPDIILNPDIQKRMAEKIKEVNKEIAAKIGINPAARVTVVKPAGTTSLILGSASGIHPHHAKRYFRRIQGNKNETPLQFFKMWNPIAVEESQWSVNKTDEIITFCIEVPKGAKVKNQISALEMLEYVKTTQQNWIKYGTNEELCVLQGMKHNVSNTIHVKDNEWKDVSDYIYENREFFTGVSLVSIHGDKDYVQAPNCAVYTLNEITHEYGEGSLLASGLIVDGLKVFNNDLWAACDCVLDIGEALFPQDIQRLISSSLEEKKKWEEIGITTDTKYALVEGWLKDNVKDIKLKRDWIRRANQFARRYFEGDVRKMTYCLKDVRNMKLWLDLNREYNEVDYTQLIEDRDDTKIQETIACGGGTCEINI